MTKHVRLTRELIDAAPFETLPPPGPKGIMSNGRNLLPSEGENSQPIVVPLSDVYNCRLLVQDYGDVIRYCGHWEKWLIYKDGVWGQDYDRQLVEYAKAAIYRLIEEGRHLLDEFDAAIAAAGPDVDPKAVKATRKVKAGLLEHARRSLGRRRLDDMIALARSEPGVPVTPDNLDQHPMLLPVANGVVNLETGKLVPHAPEFLFTRKMDVIYDKSATCPKWGQALYEIMGGPLGPDSAEASAAELEQRHAQHKRAERLVTFLQRSLGLMLTADTREHLIWIFVGNGRNGKSVVLNTLLNLFGGFGYKATQSLFMDKQFETHLTERASLFGKRLVAVSETKQGGKLDTTFVKEMTGDDQMTVRRMREDPWTFSPTHHPIMATNSLPIIDDPTDAIWDRVRVIPFDVKFVDPDIISPAELNDPSIPKQNKELSKQLLEELPGILNWLVQGCLAWQKYGLGFPAEVRFRTESYRRAMNSVEQFINEGCLSTGNIRVRANVLYQGYLTWCEHNEQQACNQRSFGQQIAQAGYQRTTSRGVAWYRGIAVKDIDIAEGSDDLGGESSKS